MGNENTEKYENLVFEDARFKLIARKSNSPYQQSTQRTAFFHEEIEIKYFLEGTTTLSIGTDTVIAKKGDVTVVNPYEVHSTIKLVGESVQYSLLMIGLDFFTQRNPHGINLRRLILEDGKRFKHLIRANTRVAEIISQIVEEMDKRAPYYESVAEGLVMELVSLLLRDSSVEADSAKSLDERIRYADTIAPALEFMHTSYPKKITIEDLSSMCCVSKYHFCRIFNRVVGVSAMQYLNDYRLKIADIMLGGTQKSIAEIALECGFSEEAYFCRCYKKSRGISALQSRAILSKK